MRGDAIYRYLRCAYDLHLRGEYITPKSMAKELNVKRPTAFEFIKKLEERGYLLRDEGGYILTNLGIQEAERVLRNHRLIETLLYRAGVSLDDACLLASKIEMDIADIDVERICEYLGNPTSCPHGKPIPRGEKFERN